MTTTSSAPKYWLPALPSGLLFGAMASLFNNIAVSVAFLLINLFFALVLSNILAPDFAAFWVLDVFLLLFAAIMGSLGIWLGIRTAARIAKMQGVHPATSRLPITGSIIVAIPILVWVMVQLAYDLSTFENVAWGNTIHLLGQALIFSGIAYIFLLHYKRRCTVEQGSVAPIVRTTMNSIAITRTALMLFGSAAFIVFLHAVEAVLRMRTSILLLEEGLLSNNAIFIAGIAGVALMSFIAALMLAKVRDLRAIVARSKTLPPWEYFLAVFSAAAGFTYAIAYAAQIGFVFSPYAVMPTTIAILLGIALSSLMYAKGRRDPAYVQSRVAAYVLGFGSQPAILSTLLPLIERIIT